MVSAESSPVTASLVRLFHGDENPQGPGYREAEVPSDLDGCYPTSYQPLFKGSYIRIDDAVDLARYPALSVHLICYPTLLGARDRTLLSASTTKGGRWSLLLDSEGRMVLDYEDPRRPDVGQRMSTRRGLVTRNWYSVVVQFDLVRRETILQVEHLAPVGAESGSLLLREERVTEPRSPACFAETTFVIGGEDRGLGDVTNTFDGKIAAPALFGEVLSPDQLNRLTTNGDLSGIRNVVASWDFGREIASRTVVDTGPSGLHGRTVNMPTRGVPGPRWKGTSVDYREAPSQYTAIHFHEDDLDDAEWLPTVELTVPNGMPSGIYAARLRDKHGNEDRIPFFVRPPRAYASAEVLLLIPTLTYLAYANNHVFEDQSIKEFFRKFGREFEFPKQEQDRYIVEQQLHSLYDRHHDGSGVCYSSWLRPLMNMRPTYRKPTLADGEGSPHLLGADLHIVDWLTAKGFKHDVVTDIDLHKEGEGLLERYRVVILASHPEYATREVLDSIQCYLNTGGRLMYLGGNGFYWVTGFDREQGHTIEVRRFGGSRTWEAEAGSWYMTTSPELGGLWRMRGRAPQKLFGTGFTAQGWGGGKPYKRTQDSLHQRVSFIFAGIGMEELIGDLPNLVDIHGAAGFEIDRADVELGTPLHAVTLATASGFSDNFQHAVEEVMNSDSAQGGSESSDVRADMVFYESSGGGAMFSVGSISWSGCLSFNGYSNNVSLVTENVLRRFLEPCPFAAPLVGEAADEPGTEAAPLLPGS